MNHTPGSTAFLDDKSRILFSGDVANPNVGATGTVSAALLSVLRVRALQSRFDRMYTGQTAYANTIEPMAQDPQILGDIIEAFRSVLRGNAETRVMRNHLFPDRTLTVAVYGGATVSFDPTRLWEDGEKHDVP